MSHALIHIHVHIQHPHDPRDRHDTQQAVRGRPLALANAALAKLSASLLGWLERVAQRDPKVKGGKRGWLEGREGTGLCVLD